MNKVLNYFFERGAVKDSTPALIKSFLVLLLFTSTLINLYPGIPLLAFMLFTFVCFYLKKIKLSISVQFIFIVFYFNLAAILFYIGFGESVLNRNHYISSLLNNLLTTNGYIIAAFVLIKSYAFFKDFYGDLFFSVLIIHILVVYLQVFYQFIFNEYLDLHKFFTGEDSRILNYKCQGIECVANRYTGIYVEPSTLTSIISSLFIIVSFNYRVRFLGIIFLISTYYLAFSTAGLVQLILLIIFFIASQNLSRTPLALSLILILLFSFILINYIFPAIMSGLNTTSIRSGFIEYLFERMDFYNAIFGLGIFDKDDQFILLASGELLGSRISSFNDTGTLIFVFATGGLVTTALLFFRFLFYLDKLKFITLMILFFSLKLGYNHAMFWICIFAMSYFNNYAVYQNYEK